MSEYKHGVYATSGRGAKEQAKALKQAFVYVGASPILQTKGWRERIHKPIVVTSFQDAVEKFGFSWDFVTYPLCEAMYENFVLYHNGPVVMICAVKNVMTYLQTVTAETSNGMFTLELAKEGSSVTLDPDRIDMDTLNVTDTDENEIAFYAKYNADESRIEVYETEEGTFPKTVKCKFEHFSYTGKFGVNFVDITGSDDGEGKRTGVFAVRDVYTHTGMIPSYLISG